MWKGCPVAFEGGVVRLLDQRRLPHEVIWLQFDTAAGVADAISDLIVRGAPAIGITAAYGMAVAATRGEDLEVAASTLIAARPTAVNLRWAVEKMLLFARADIVAAAVALHKADVTANHALGEHGARLLGPGSRVLTHCNAGALATGGWGTALGIVRTAHAAGRLAEVFASETRPWLQGARLTAWELAQDGIPVTVLCEGAVASLFASGRVDAVIVGADRVAANGDTANKVGTFGLAVLARHFSVPFYVAVPVSTLDSQTATGAEITIEHRGADEVYGWSGLRWAADVPAYNPVFDVTPSALVTAWITEEGPWNPR